ncbi:74b0429c-de52-4f42-8180-4c1085c72440 [Sclerotinia trifoliorum]|uniref:74b0429c-de52-4f42-8180-4c1085c72440 n=1 Tax=Sclerotinia trifoliorum TaxID=28548 RepID=A0A8H2VZY2_9HELO|nr:74b0429c-de52-4f42-8180-4c1085c72440 [Sclerotinia trifoliorum]
MVCNGKLLFSSPIATFPDDFIISSPSQCNKELLEDDDENLEKVKNDIKDIICEAESQKFTLLTPETERGPSSLPILQNSVRKPSTFLWLSLIENNLDIVQEYPSIEFYPRLAINVILKSSRYSIQKVLFTRKLMRIAYIAKVCISDMICVSGC